ncbi:hypothetical protein HK104_010802 [Borealophlyctis nickersoniae]|nr:hypothetical protein HK104_010802 [Borealophlyctis nickersoniae]
MSSTSSLSSGMYYNPVHHRHRCDRADFSSARFGGDLAWLARKAVKDNIAEESSAHDENDSALPASSVLTPQDTEMDTETDSTRDQTGTTNGPRNLETISPQQFLQLDAISKLRSAALKNEESDLLAQLGKLMVERESRGIRDEDQLSATSEESWVQELNREVDILEGTAIHQNSETALPAPPNVHSISERWIPSKLRSILTRYPHPAGEQSTPNIAPAADHNTAPAVSTTDAKPKRPFVRFLSSSSRVAPNPSSLNALAESKTQVNLPDVEDEENIQRSSSQDATSPTTHAGAEPVSHDHEEPVVHESQKGSKFPLVSLFKSRLSSSRLSLSARTLSASSVPPSDIPAAAEPSDTARADVEATETRTKNRKFFKTAADSLTSLFRPSSASKQSASPSPSEPVGAPVEQVRGRITAERGQLPSVLAATGATPTPSAPAPPTSILAKWRAKLRGTFARRHRHAATYVNIVTSATQETSHPIGRRNVVTGQEEYFPEGEDTGTRRQARPDRNRRTDDDDADFIGVVSPSHGPGGEFARDPAYIAYHAHRRQYLGRGYGVA